MKRYIIGAMAGIVTWYAAAEPVAAQLVQVNPGYVRAPFVRVYRDPNGVTRVQAPFVDLYAPGRYAADRWNRDPRDAATREELRQMPEARLRRQLFGSALDLDRALDRFETGESWQRYLSVAPGLPLSRDRFDSAEITRTNGQLATVLAHFDAVSKNADYRMIAALPAFQWTHELLAEYLDARRMSQSAAHPTPAEELPPPQPLDPLDE